MVKGWTNNEFDIPGGLTIGSAIQSDAAGAFTISPTAGQVLQLDDSNVTVDGGVLTVSSSGRIVNEAMRMKAGYFENLGCSLLAGTFTIHAADGIALSASNPAYVCLESKTTPGELVLYTITANQTFIDDAGVSTIIGALLGFTAGVAVTVDIPFFIYACSADDQTTITFGLSRTPHKKVAPASGDIGVGGTPAAASAQTGLFLFGAVTATDYDLNPITRIGWIPMQMSALDDWTVQALATTNGIGIFPSSENFTMPLGQFGSNASSLTFDNGGTAPIFSTEDGNYFIDGDGRCEYNFALRADGGADGSGAVEAQVAIPFFPDGTITGQGGGGMGIINVRNAAANTYKGAMSVMRIAGGNQAMFFYDTGTLTRWQWTSWSNGQREIFGTHRCKIAV